MKPRLMGGGWVAILIFLISGPAFAQEATLSGRITDRTTESTLPGANVVIEELNIGAAADNDGVYQLPVPADRVNGQTVTLVARFVGFATQRRQITLDAGEQTQDFALEPDLLNLEEVVVTGVGEQTERRRLGIEVASVDAEKLQAAPALTVESALAGKIAGARITQGSGQPGVSASIILRGINSLGNTTPLILIDGVQVSTTSNYAGTSEDGSTAPGGGDIFFNSNSRLADIDFSDVERVEVTKGAAASTIYGAQGANGVIQIFTRSGQTGRPRLTLTSSISADETLGDVEKAQFHFFDTNPDGTIVGAVRNEETGQWTLPSASVTANTINNKPFVEETFDTLDEVLRTGVTQRYGASLSGGTDLFTYLFSANVQDQEGVVETTFQQRNSYRLNVGITPLKNLDIKVRTNFIDIDNRGTETGNNVEAPFSQALFTPQFIDISAPNADGEIVATSIQDDTSTNPLFEFNTVNKDVSTVRFIGGTQANYTPFDWLELDYTLGLDHYRYEYNELIRNFEDNEIATLTPTVGRVIRLDDKSTTFTSTLTALLRADLPSDVASTTQLAFDVRSEDFNQTFAQGQGLPPFENTTTLRSAAERFNDEFDSEFNTFGFLVNQRLEWDETIGVSGGGRVDYSSAFGEGEEASFFPRGDIFIRLSQFDFWSPLKSPLDEFKLRAAYGEAGIQPGPFDRVRTLAQEPIGQSNALLSPLTLQNERLSVEESREFEIGTDFSFNFGPRALFSPLSVDFTYWVRNTENIIEEIDLAPSAGAENILTNGVDIRSFGFDLALRSLTLYRDNFTWQTTLNFGRATSEVDNIASGEDIVVREEYVLREGEEVGTHFGFNAVRALDERADPDDPNSAFILDFNGDGVVDASDGDFVFVDGRVVDANTRQVVFRPFKERLGDPSPAFTLGFRNDFNVGSNLGFGFQFDWVQGPDIYNQTRQWLYRDFIHEDWDEPVTIGDETAPFAAYYQSIYKTNDKNEFFVEDGSYLRLREAYISYDVADLLTRLTDGRQLVERFRFTLSGRNLLTFTDYSGFDPEVDQNGGDPRIRGLDEFTFPGFRTITFGTSIQF